MTTYRTSPSNTSPATEPGRVAADESTRRMRIPRTFVLATKEVTVEQFLRFQPKHNWIKRYSPGPDTPAVAVTWYEAAAYCNWLSEREGIPRDQWCYEPNKDGAYAAGMRMRTGHLNLTGYRLPTEAEWEYACRGGTGTARYYRRGADLLSRYGWFKNNSNDRAWVCGSLRPNERGLFDTLGNAWEWCEDPGQPGAPTATEDTEHKNHLQITEESNRVLRGGSFGNQPVYLRAAYRDYYDRPGNRSEGVGFRPVRTRPE